MKQDVTSFTRYFFILILVFVFWLCLIYSKNVHTVLNQLFGVESNSLSINCK